MLVPKDHVSRKPTDTYYVNPKSVLRTHTSAHEAEMMRNNIKAFLITGDVYRRDEIDASHYPVFHQVEGVRFFPQVSLDYKKTQNLLFLNPTAQRSNGLINDNF